MNAEKYSIDHGSNSIKNVSEYLTFKLGNEGYGIEILKVQEIRGYDQVTQIANTPDYIKGVINLRGMIVPILDLRIKFKLKNIEYDEFTVVIILQLHSRVVGIVVDGVSDVIELKAEQIRDVPSVVTCIDNKYVVGLATLDQRMLILINIEQLVSTEEMDLIEEKAA